MQQSLGKTEIRLRCPYPVQFVEVPLTGQRWKMIEVEHDGDLIVCIFLQDMSKTCPPVRVQTGLLLTSMLIVVWM